jgi:hypothetical protein
MNTSIISHLQDNNSSSPQRRLQANNGLNYYRVKGGASEIDANAASY